MTITKEELVKLLIQNLSETELTEFKKGITKYNKRITKRKMIDFAAMQKTNGITKPDNKEARLHKETTQLLISKILELQAEVDKNRKDKDKGAEQDTVAVGQ